VYINVLLVSQVDSNKQCFHNVYAYLSAARNRLQQPKAGEILNPRFDDDRISGTRLVSTKNCVADVARRMVTRSGCLENCSGHSSTYVRLPLQAGSKTGGRRCREPDCFQDNEVHRYVRRAEAASRACYKVSW
jgi:hypothetical protein